MLLPTTATCTHINHLGLPVPLPHHQRDRSRGERTCRSGVVDHQAQVREWQGRLYNGAGGNLDETPRKRCLYFTRTTPTIENLRIIFFFDHFTCVFVLNYAPRHGHGMHHTYVNARFGIVCMGFCPLLYTGNKPRHRREMINST